VATRVNNQFSETNGCTPAAYSMKTANTSEQSRYGIGTIYNKSI